MSWLSSLFGGGAKVVQPDTTAQEAELKRQTDLLMQQFQAYMTAQQKQFTDERTADETKDANQRAADLAEQQRQSDALKALQDSQTASQSAINAQLKQQADAAAALDATRATNARDYATGRGNLIDQMTAALNTVYGGFDDNYYNNFAGAVTDAQRPALDKEYADDRRSSRLALANVGNLDSSAGARALGNVKQAYQTKLGQAAASGSDAAASLRSQIQTQKNSALSGLVNSAFVGDPTLSQYDTDVGGALDQITGRLNNYLSGVVDNVKQYAPLGTTGAAPGITTPTITSPLLTSLTGTGTGTGPTNGGNVTQQQPAIVD